MLSRLVPVPERSTALVPTARTPAASQRTATAAPLDSFDARTAATGGATAVGPVQAATAAIPARVQKVFDELTSVMFDRTGRLWPGYDWRQKQFMVVDPRVNQAYLWNDGGAQPGMPPRITTLAADQLPPEFRASYTFSDWNGLPTLGVSLEHMEEMDPQGTRGYGDILHRFAAHEGFHYFGQGNFDVPSGTGFESRLPEFPERHEARYYRAKVLGSLVDSLKAATPEARAEAKSAAAYWNQKFKTEMPDLADAAAGLDVAEGSARLIEYLSVAAGKLGADRPDSELAADMVQHLDELISTDGFERDGEPYNLGAAAGLILLAEGRLPQAAPRIEQGLALVDAALEGVAPTEQPDDPETLQKVRAAVDGRNVENGAMIEALRGELNDPANVRLLVPAGWLAGAFGFRGGFRLTQEPGQPMVFEGLSGAYVQPGSNALIELDGRTAITTRPPTDGAPPSRGYYSVPVAKSAITMNADGTMTIQSDKVRATGLRARQVDRNGEKWLVPELPASGEISSEPAGSESVPAAPSARLQARS